MALYPLKFKPRLLEKMWAGRKIQTVLDKALPEGKQIGESWEIYDFPPGVVENSGQWVSSEVAAGPLAGKTLHQLIGMFGRELMGDVPLAGAVRQFPLLIKFLDAREDLSIQVHPDGLYAAAHPDAYLKSEAWYIVQSDPGARLFRGLKPGTSRRQFAQSIEQGNCENLLNSIPVKPGECFYLPSGTVHAVGAGILAAEVQTPSDTTFRVYDFNRVDPLIGTTRKLHVKEAMECIHFSAEAPSDHPVSHSAGLQAEQKKLVSCEFFEMEEAGVKAGVTEEVAYHQPVIWMMLEGRGQVTVGGGGEPAKFARGDTLLLPAVMDKPLLSTFTDCRWLEVSLPHRGG